MSWMETDVAELIDTGEKRDTLGRRRSDALRRAELVQAYQQSGLTMAAFAKRECIHYTTFAGWVARCRRGKGGKRSRVRFAEVRLPAVAPTGLGAVVEVRLMDGTVVRGSSASEVAALVRALRTPSTSLRAPSQSRG